MVTHRIGIVLISVALSIGAGAGSSLAPVSGFDPENDDGVAPYEGGTWSVVAIDRNTGDVGVAAATCLPIDVTALAALAPGKGAAAVQADFEVDNRNALLQRMDQGERADDIVAALSSEEHDTNNGYRQYGVVTMHGDEIVTAGFSGDMTRRWKGVVHSLDHAVTVQGNHLTGPEVVENALAAFIEPVGSDVMLSDRILRALEAGSSAGGDWRCNDHGIVQTAMSAFLSVSRGDQPPFAARHLGDTGTDYSEYPWIHLSSVEVDDGPNPIVGLRRQYDEWRTENLPPCEACSGLAIPVPLGGEGVALSDAPAEPPPKATDTPEGAVPTDAMSSAPTVVSEVASDGPASTDEGDPAADDSTIAEPVQPADDDGPPVGALIAIFVAVGGGLVATFGAIAASKKE